MLDFNKCVLCDAADYDTIKTKWFDYPIDNFVKQIFDSEDIADAETAIVEVMQFPAGDVIVDIALTIREDDGSFTDVEQTPLIDGIHYNYDEALNLFNKAEFER